MYGELILRPTGIHTQLKDLYTGIHSYTGLHTAIQGYTQLYRAIYS